MTALRTTFGRYRIIEEIGRGGFATVYRALDPALQREVALKALQPHLAAEPNLRQRFLAEAQALASLRHPNVVTVYDVGQADGQPFFAMELIDGWALGDLLAQHGPPELAEATALLQQLASAIDYLHAAGLVHRDIKAANVMRDRAGRVVLMDFGIARLLDGTHQTQTGVSLGTAETMAPEQVRGEAAGPAADIYALGILAYQLLAGRPPFLGNTAHVLYAQAHEPPPPLEQVRPGLPRGVYAAVEAALAKEPDWRPGSAGAFVQMLAGAAPAPPPRPAPPPVRVEPGPDRVVPPVSPAGGVSPLVIGAAVAGVALLALVGLLLVLLSRGRSRPIEPANAGNPTVVAAPSPTPATPAPTAQPTPPPTAAPTPPPAGRFAGGQIVRANVPGAGACLNQREEPSLSATVVTCLADGVNLRVMEGPVDADGHNWWRLQSWDGSGGGGWSDEASLALSVSCDRDRTATSCNPASAPPVARQTPPPTAPPTAPPVARQTPPPNGPPSPPDLGLTRSPGSGVPSLQILSVSPAGPATAGGTFAFAVTAKNFGAGGKSGSITVSAVGASSLDATAGRCDMAAKAVALAPGATVATLGGETLSTVGKVQSRNWLAEVQFPDGWPSGSTCTLNVSARVPANGQLSFLLRTADYTTDGRIAYWPYGAQFDHDQQGFSSIRWGVPVVSP